MNTSRRGQGLTEYIILVALLAIATIGITMIFGDEVRELFGVSSDALTGTERVRVRREGESPERRTLADFAKMQEADCATGACQL